MHSTASPAVEKGDMVQDMYILENWAKEREMQESDKKRAEASHTGRWKNGEREPLMGMKCVEGKKGER